MPTIPQRAQQRSVLPNTAPTTLQSANGVNANTFGGDGGFGALGQGLAQVAEDVEEYADEENERDAKVRDAAYGQAVNGLLFGDPDSGTTGLFSLQGQAAIDAAPAFRQAMAEARTKAGEGANSQVSGVLEHAFNQRDGVVRNQTGRFRVAETNRAGASSDEARKILAGSNYTNDYMNAPVTVQAFSNVDSASASEAKRGGHAVGSPESDAIHMQNRTALVKQAFDAAISKGDMNGAEMILSNSPGVNPSLRATMLKDLKEKNTLAAAQKAFAVVDSNPELNALPLSKQLEAKKKALKELLLGPEQNKEALAMLRKDFRDDNIALSSADSQLQRAHNLRIRELAVATEKTRAEVNKVVEDGMSYLDWAADGDNADKLKLLSHTERKAYEKRSAEIDQGVPAITTPAGYQLINRLAGMTPRQRSEQAAHLNAHRKIIGGDEWPLVKSMIFGGTAGTGQRNEASNKVLASAAYERLKIDGRGKANERGQFDAEFARRLEDFKEEQAGRRNPSVEQRQKIIDEMLAPIAVRGWLGTGTQPSFKVQQGLTPEDLQDAETSLQVGSGGKRTNFTRQEIIDEAISKKGRSAASRTRQAIPVITRKVGDLKDNFRERAAERDRRLEGRKNDK